MAASEASEFDRWLSNKLTSINPDVDLDVFLSYICGILEEEESTQDEINESIGSILAEISEDIDPALVSSVISSKWKETHSSQKPIQTKDVSLESTMHSHVEKLANMPIKTQKNSTAVDVNKAAILAQYNQVYDGEPSDEEEEPENTRSEELLLKNMNAISVKQREIEEKEKSKRQNEEKKQRDKEEREKQKQKAADRKDAEKKRTQKGERRR